MSRWMDNGRRKRALFYGRVSTDHREQDSSIEAQMQLAESFFRLHPDMELAEPLETYVERESAKSDIRPAFSRLISRLAKGDIDYLCIKDLKRLSRSSEVSAKLKRLCKEYGFMLLLLDTGQEYDPNSDNYRMLYGFESLINEDYVIRQSNYGKLAHRQKMEARRLNRNNVTFGYQWDYGKGCMAINDEEAAIIREIYDLFVFGNRGVAEIRKHLAGLGYRRSLNTVRKWLSDTSYIGVFNMNKKSSDLGIGVGEKTRRYGLPKEEWVKVEAPDLRIVDQEVFDLAQRLRESRQTFYQPDRNGIRQGRFDGTHLFSGLVYCGSCGYSYIHFYADRKRTVGIYTDSSARKGNPMEPCQNPNRRLYESDLVSITVAAVNRMIEGSGAYIDEFMGAVAAVLNEGGEDSEKRKRLEREIGRAEKEAQRTKQAYIQASGALRKSLEDDYNMLYAKAASMKEELGELLSRSADRARLEEETHSKLLQIREALSAAGTLTEGALTRDVIRTFIKRITVTSGRGILIEMNTGAILRSQGKGDGDAGNGFPDGCDGMLREAEICSFSYTSPVKRKPGPVTYSVKVILGGMA